MKKEYCILSPWEMIAGTEEEPIAERVTFDILFPYPFYLHESMEQRKLWLNALANNPNMSRWITERMKKEENGFGFGIKFLGLFTIPLNVNLVSSDGQIKVFICSFSGVNTLCCNRMYWLLSKRKGKNSRKMNLNIYFGK